MKKSARAAGVLFLVATGAFMIGNGLLEPLLSGPDFLAGLYPDRTEVIAGSFLELLNAVAVVGIAMLLYPILKRHNEALALGYFGSRILESALLLASLTVPLVLIPFSERYMAEGAGAGSAFQTIGKFAADAHFILFDIAMVALGLGSLLLCFVLYRSKLVPRWLSVIGFIGYASLLSSSCLAIAGVDAGFVLFMPGAVFEIVFPIWLIVKGLDRPADSSV